MQHTQLQLLRHFVSSLKLISTSGTAARRHQPATHKQRDTLVWSPLKFPPDWEIVDWSSISVHIHKCSCNSYMSSPRCRGQAEKSARPAQAIFKYTPFSYMKVNILVGLLFLIDSFPYVMFSHCIFPPLMLFQHIPTVLALHNHSTLNYNTLYYHSLPSCTIHVITDDKSSHSQPKRILYGCFYKWVQLLYQN